MQALEFGRYYHIYNRGVNSCNLFEENSNFEHFLRLYEKYILPVADTFAFCLMSNHFHFLVRIKEKKEIFEKANLSGIQNPDRFIFQTGPQNNFLTFLMHILKLSTNATVVQAHYSKGLLNGF